ncbi:MAG: RHS repeat domain-containing protein [Paludibacteraceae bacterium]
MYIRIKKYLVLTTPDHLGNIRESWVYSLDKPISEGLLQRTQYYPSGLPWNKGYSPSEQPYKYGGKEFVEMHGLDEYDSEARWYYPAIMRTTTMDPLCEQYYDTSPYVWCGNNPIRNVDLNGEDWYVTDDGISIIWRESDDDEIEINGVSYKNKGKSYTYNIGNVAYSYYQNDLQTISYGTNTTFYNQLEKTSCKLACEQMVSSSGTTPMKDRSGEILMTNHDINGVVTTATQDFQLGLYRLEDYLSNGMPCIIGVDYKNEQKHNLAPNGDGMTDHFVTIVGMTINVNSGNISYNFYDPGSQYRGNNPNNIIFLEGNFLKGLTAARGNPFTVTTIRKNK